MIESVEDAVSRLVVGVCEKRTDPSTRFAKAAIHDGRPSRDRIAAAGVHRHSGSPRHRPETLRAEGSHRHVFYVDEVGFREFSATALAGEVAR